MITQVVYIFSQFFIGCCLGVLLCDFFDRKHPNEYNIVKGHITNLLINASYNCIYFYSKCQILLTKYIAKNPYYLQLVTTIESIKSKMFYDSKNRLEFLFIKDNLHYNVPCESCDLIIATDTSKKPALKKILYDENVKENVLVFEESDTKFMLVEFKIGDKSYKIDLKNNTYNYYVVDNMFTKDFFIYYINEHVLTKYEQHEKDKYVKYSLKILDQDVNMIEIDFDDNKRIILENSGYKLINS